MNPIDRMFQLHQQYRKLKDGAAIQRLPLASGYAEGLGVWRLEVAEYLAEKVESEDFVETMLLCERQRMSLPNIYIRRQIELHIGHTMTALSCPVRIDAQHIETNKSERKYDAF